MTAISEETATFNGAGGEKIYYRCWLNPAERVRLVIAHGLGEHSQRYGNVINRLLPSGMSIWALDHRGHGRSTGTRGHILNFDQYLHDLRHLVQLAAEKPPQGRRLFLLGHSMGGLIAIHFALRNPDMIDGLITSSPALGMIIEVPALKAVLGKLMSKVWPTLLLGNELDSTRISRDGQVVQAYQDDPLVHDRISTRWFTEFLAAMEIAQQRSTDITLPVLMQVAGEDYLVSAAASQAFFKKLGSADKILHVYDGLYHEIYNELPEDRESVLADLEKWLESHID